MTSLSAAIAALLEAGIPEDDLCAMPSSHRLPLCSDRTRYLLEVEDKEELTRNIIGTIVSVLFVALGAGLFLGFMTLDDMDLRIIQRSSLDVDEKVYATNLIPIVQQRHRLLVTLLIFDTVAYETLPIFMDALVPSAFAVALSTLLIMVFGEIIPSAFFTGPHQLYLANFVAPFVSFLMTALYPMVYPLARILDVLTHEKSDPTTAEEYNRGELSALIRIQYEQRTKGFRGRAAFRQRDKYKYDPTNDGPTWKALKREILEAAHERDTDLRSTHDDELTTDSPPPALEEQLEPPMHIAEVKMMEGALQMRTRIALDVYTPLSKLYAISEDLILNKGTIFNIYYEGFSRVPVFRPNPDDPTNDGPTWKALKREILEAAHERDTDLRSTHDDELTTDSPPPALEEQLEPPMHIAEVKMMEGALQMRTRIALDVYTPLSKLYAISEDLILNKGTIFNIYYEGFSRVPVFRPNPDDPHDNTQILGFLMTRTLMMIDWEHERAVSTLNASFLQPDCINPRMSLVQLLPKLREGGSLMAFVCARPDIARDALADGKPLPVEAGFMGVITMQDVVECILQDPVYDEVDYKERERAVATLQRWAATRLQKVFRRKQAQRLLQQARIEARRHSGSVNDLNDRTPLLGAGSTDGRVYSSVGDIV